MYSKNQPIGKFIKSILVKHFPDTNWSARMPIWKVNRILSDDYRRSHYVSIGDYGIALYEYD
jgi:hypothetical protein